MKPISNSSMCLTVYLMLCGVLLGQAPEGIIDLDRVADLLQFPRSELVISDYTEKTKFIYTKRNTSEENSNRMPPVDPESIYKSYWVASKTPNAFLPIIISISKPDAYLTPKVKEMIEGLNAYAATQRSQGVHYPYGDFELPGASDASIFWAEIRVPAHSNQVIEPGDTWTRLDEYPTNHPATVSIVRDSSSEVDVWIAQYSCLYYPDKLIKLRGGEDYFAAFNDDTEDDPKENPRVNIFKELNQIVLASAIMNPYRKTPPPRPPESSKAEAGKPTESPAAPLKIPPPPREPEYAVGSPNTSKILVFVLLMLGAIAAIVFKIRKRRV